MTKDKKILLVDDDPSLVYLLTEYLKHYNFVVNSVHSAKKALELTDYNPSLLLIDMLLPDLKGVELAQSLLAKYQQKNIPVIFMSARKHEELEKDEIPKKDNFYFLSKPFPLDEMKVLIEEALNNLAFN
jgi:DNA-binding response OmpR family regulator